MENKNQIKTIEEAKQLLSENWEKGIDCPCCRQRVKLYRRPMHAGIGLMLIRLYRLGDGYHHASKIVEGISGTGTGDFAKLRFWGLVVEGANDGENRNSGKWAITEEGKRFAKGEIALLSHVKIYNQECYGLTGKHVTIREVLGKKFSYEEIMSN